MVSYESVKDQFNLLGIDLGHVADIVGKKYPEMQEKYEEVFHQERNRDSQEYMKQPWKCIILYWKNLRRNAIIIK